MAAAESRALRFVRALVGGAVAVSSGEGPFAIDAGGRALRLDRAAVRALVAEGVLTVDGVTCRATLDARTWLRRRLAETDAFATQHRALVRATDGTLINLEESPLARLAVPAAGESEAFLAPHHVQAGERVRRLAERARLQPRLTMSYDQARAAGRKPAGAGAEISDLAADARKALGEIPKVLPRDCAGVVLDVCGLLKGLQVVETERGWPRRSAKLVLRIGLDQLARHYGYAAEAIGPRSRGDRTWLGEGARPGVFE